MRSDRTEFVSGYALSLMVEKSEHTMYRSPSYTDTATVKGPLCKALVMAVNTDPSESTLNGVDVPFSISIFRIIKGISGECGDVMSDSALGKHATNNSSGLSGDALTLSHAYTLSM